MRNEPLVDYALRLAGAAPNEVKFVVLDGSTAEGNDAKYSDYDVVVVKKGRLKRPGSVEGLYGVFGGRIVSGWLVDEESFRSRYIGGDDEEFVWRRKQLRKARLLYGDATEFNRIVRAALKRRWNRARQVAVVEYSYVTMIEYMGKMLNKAGADDTPEFYQDGYIVAKNAALLIAALNRIDLDSDKNMYQQILSQAKIKPSDFARDFTTASGLSGSRRERKEVVSASRRLVRWARKEVIRLLESTDGDDPGFLQLAREIRY